MVNCKICNSASHEIFESLVLNKHIVKYFQCQNCKFIQTEEPYWLKEAYESSIGFLDVGILHRNNALSSATETILEKLKIDTGKYLDYGGGYGIFVRLMRDLGFDFYYYDKFPNNLFARCFERDIAKIDEKFTLLTAFEVFEHLESPVTEIEKLFVLSDVIIFSTELQPNIKFKNVDDWWYFVPKGGQHISFYNLETLTVIKKIFNCFLYTNNFNLHILSKKQLYLDPFNNELKEESLSQKINRKLFGKNIGGNLPKRKSLLMQDFEYYNKIIFQNES